MALVTPSIYPNSVEETVPIEVVEGRVTTPVNVGLADGAFRLSAVVTKAVVANCVVMVPAIAVGAVGIPVKVGLAKGAFRLSAVVTKAVVASCVVFVPAVAVGATGIPVSVGLVSVGFAKGAFALICVWIALVVPSR